MRVLLIEDEQRLAALIAEGLQAEGIQVDVEHDGDAGLWRGTEGSYDAIVCDIMLPGRNGYTICRELRAAGVWTPILMLTAKDGEYDEAEALDLGADDFLRKPFSYVVLLARLRALVRRGAPERPTELEAGPLRFDPATNELTCKGEQVALSKRELAVLQMLMRANGSVVGRQEILDRVWGLDDEPTSNVVDVNIRYLRRKFTDACGDPLILTVRGVGYRLESE